MSDRFEDIITVGFDKNGEVDFRVRDTIGDLSLEQMDKLRAMTFVAIATAEDMRRRAIALSHEPTGKAGTLA